MSASWPPDPKQPTGFYDLGMSRGARVFRTGLSAVILVVGVLLIVSAAGGLRAAHWSIGDASPNLPNTETGWFLICEIGWGAGIVLFAAGGLVVSWAPLRSEPFFVGATAVAVTSVLAVVPAVLVGSAPVAAAVALLVVIALGAGATRYLLRFLGRRAPEAERLRLRHYVNAGMVVFAALALLGIDIGNADAVRVAFLGAHECSFGETAACYLVVPADFVSEQDTGGGYRSSSSECTVIFRTANTDVQTSFQRPCLSMILICPCRLTVFQNDVMSVSDRARTTVRTEEYRDSPNAATVDYIIATLGALGFLLSVGVRIRGLTRGDPVPDGGGPRQRTTPATTRWTIRRRTSARRPPRASGSTSACATSEATDDR